MEWLDVALPIIKTIALAIIVLLVGLFVIKIITNVVKKRIEKSKLDSTLKPFLVSITGTVLKVLLVLSVIKILGVDITSFVAIIAAAGFAIGLAFQGSLANFAGGILLLSLRPFRVGDYIEAAGYSGTVDGIQILYTELLTPDNKVIYVPNGELSNAGIVNYSVKDTRRVDFAIGATYEADTDHVLEVLHDIVGKHSLTFQDPEPFVRVAEHGESGVIYAVRVWTKAEDYWTVHFDVLEDVKKRFKEEGIAIPYPKVNVEVKQ